MVSQARETDACVCSRMNEVSQESIDFCLQKYNFWSGMINM